MRPSGPWGPWGVGRTRFRFRKHVAPGGGTPGRPFQYVFGPSWRSGRPRRAGLCAPVPHVCPSGPGELGGCPRRKGPVVRRDSWQPGPVPRVSRPVRGRVSAYGVRDASCCLLRSHTRARRIRLVRELPFVGFSGSCVGLRASEQASSRFRARFGLGARAVPKATLVVKFNTPRAPTTPSFSLARPYLARLLAASACVPLHAPLLWFKLMSVSLSLYLYISMTIL